MKRPTKRIVTTVAAAALTISLGSGQLAMTALAAEPAGKDHGDITVDMLKGAALENGTYNTNVSLMNANGSGSPSMAAAVLSPDAVLEVKDGVYTLTVKFQYATIMGMGAYADNIRYTKAGSEDLINGEVVSTVGDTEYPEEVKLTLDEEQIGTMISVTMDAVIASSGQTMPGMKALLSVDWDNLEQQAPVVDKTPLNDAIKEAKAITQGDKTEEAWNALQEAIKTAEQAAAGDLTAEQVNEAVNALEQAVADFNSSEDAPLDYKNLKDGVYAVSGTLLKTNGTDASMADSALANKDYMKLTVKDGSYTLTMNFKGINIGGSLGYLSDLKYYDNGYTYSSSGIPQGTLLDASVISTQKNEDGTDVIDQYNDKDSLYPAVVELPIVSQAIEDQYIPLQVSVPVMEAMAPGFGDQQVLLKLDWETISETDENDPGFAEDGSGDQQGGSGQDEGSDVKDPAGSQGDDTTDPGAAGNSGDDMQDPGAADESGNDGDVSAAGDNSSTGTQIGDIAKTADGAPVTAAAAGMFGAAILAAAAFFKRRTVK